MKLTHILSEPKEVQAQYLPRLTKALHFLHKDLLEMQKELINITQNYAQALKDARTPALIKAYGQEVLDDDINRINTHLEYQQGWIHSTIKDINLYEFVIKEIRKNFSN